MGRQDRATIDQRQVAPGAAAQDGPRGEHAVVRLRSTSLVTPQALLEAAEGVRRALRLVGVTDVSIEVGTEDAGAD